QDVRLIQIARTSASPNAAFDMALGLGHSPLHAKSCRFLAVIRRDYGTLVFDAAICESRRSERSVELEKAARRIALLEEVAEQSFVIEQLAGTHVARLAEYLKLEPTGINGTLLIDPFRLQLVYGGHTRIEDELRVFRCDVHLTVLNPAQQVIQHQWCSEPLRCEGDPSTDELGSAFLKFIQELIGARSFGHNQFRRFTLLDVFCQHLTTKMGMVLPPHPEKFLRTGPYREWPMNRGDVAEVERRINEQRAAAVAQGVQPRLMAVFEDEARVCLERTRACAQGFDPAFLREATLGGMQHIGRTAGPSKHAFVLYCPTERVEAWSAALEAAGHQGALLDWTTTANVSAGLTVRLCPSAILLDDHIGFASKEAWAEAAAADAVRRFGVRPPIFVWAGDDPTEFESAFHAFLREHCALA
ncbi:MAG: hypothetical protein Q8P82_01790, partial [bacterium]|nr:hypothetical protein [bacterium]